MSGRLASTGERWRALAASDLAAIEELFAEAIQLDTDARRAFLAERCAERPDLAREVDALLASHGAAAEAIEGGEHVEAPSPLPGLEPGAIVGQYRILEPIAAGGMGAVYRAARADGLFEQRVAIKVIAGTLRERESARRFTAERQILASLQHPNIVTLLDGGTTPSGQPYLVMEHVDGVPITSYCRDRRLSLRERLVLLRQVCGAVQYAHQHSIVHRDLKPANILITPDGVPKVLDFGIAKLLDCTPAAGSTLTGLFAAPLTPNYASPEQLRGLPVTTACDVYALGVLVYEVVAGVRPYETAGRPLDEVLEIVLRTDPARPSAARARTDGGPTAACDYSWRRLEGDLDAIVLKALDKEAARRYQSAGEFGDDLQRFMDGQPVVAREPSTLYILRRLAGRNRTAVTIAAASLLAIVAALGLALWQRHEARRAQIRAETRFSEVRRLANTLIFKIHDAVAPLPGSTPVRQTIVAEGLEYLEHLEADSADDPSLQLELSGGYRQIAGILGDPQRPNLGDEAGALKQLQRARALAIAVADRPNLSFEAVNAVVGCDGMLASVLLQMAQLPRARASAVEGLRYARRASDASPADKRLRHLVALAAFDAAMVTARVDRRKSLPEWREAGAIFEDELKEKPDDPGRLRNLALVEKYVGALLERIGPPAEVEEHYTRALDLDRRRIEAAPEDRVAQFDVAIDYANMADVAAKGGDGKRAAEMYTRSLALREDLARSDPRDALAKMKVGTVAWRLANIELDLGHVDAARVAGQRAVDVLVAAFRSTHGLAAKSELAGAFDALGAVERASRHPAIACGLYRRATDLFADASVRDYIPHAADHASRSMAECSRRSAR